MVALLPPPESRHVCCPANTVPSRKLGNEADACVPAFIATDPDDDVIDDEEEKYSITTQCTARLTAGRAGDGWDLMAEYKTNQDGHCSICGTWCTASAY